MRFTEKHVKESVCEILYQSGFSTVPEREPYQADIAVTSVVLAKTLVLRSDSSWTDLSIAFHHATDATVHANTFSSRGTSGRFSCATAALVNFVHIL